MADALPFSFPLAEAKDEAKAREDLDEAIAVMVAQPAVEAALAEATAAVAEGFTEDAFARQVALLRKRQELEERLANLMLADDGNLDD